MNKKSSHSTKYEQLRTSQFEGVKYKITIHKLTWGFFFSRKIIQMTFNLQWRFVNQTHVLLLKEKIASVSLFCFIVDLSFSVCWLAFVALLSFHVAWKNVCLALLQHIERSLCKKKAFKNVMRAQIDFFLSLILIVLCGSVGFE